jgi:ATP-dependent Zn protease
MICGAKVEAVADPREAIAYHEAGHAVISMKLGYKCLYVTITPDGDRLGHACCEDPLIGGRDDKIEHALKVLIAASLAESRHIGSRTWGDADDRVKATNLALLATDRDIERAEALINEMIGEARKLVEQHWPDIEALAQRLLVKERVNFLEIEARASENLAPGARKEVREPRNSPPAI